MRPSRTIARLGAFVCLFVTASLWARTALQSSAAPADFLDVPGSLAANADGDVYVSFATDTATSVMRRFSADGAVLAHWEVTRGDIIHYDVAESADGGVYFALRDKGLVRYCFSDGSICANYRVPGLGRPISTAPRYGSAETEEYVMVSLTEGAREVRRYGRTGDLRASFPVTPSAHDLAASWVYQSGGQDVFVAEGAPSAAGETIVRFGPDGTRLSEWEAGGPIAGMDVGRAAEHLWVGVSQPSEATRNLQEYQYDGTPGTRCELPAYPIDLTVGQGGDLFVLAYEDPAQDMYREVLRYRQDCTLVDTWDLEQLNGLEQPTPTGPAPTASETPCHWPSATGTATVVAATATETPGSASPSTTPTSGPTPTYHTECGGKLFLPKASRGIG